jgi:hypothetical protein
MAMARKRKRRRRGAGIDRRLLILFSVMPIGCLLAILVGLAITWYVSPTRYVNARASDLSQEYVDEIIIMAAADYAEYQDVARAKTVLAELNVPNTSQYVSLVAERMIRTNRGPVDQDIENVVQLADALGVSTVSMIAYVSTPTALPTATSLPTPTPTNTLVVEAVAQAAVKSVETVEVEVAEESGPTSTATSSPPTDTPVPTPEPVEPTAAPTEVPVPPTDTPEPVAAASSEHDFVIAKQRLLTKEENGGCLGMHSIFVTVVDGGGNPIRGAEISDVWGNPGPITGHKGDDNPGLAVYDLYKNGFKIFVKNDPTAGRQVTSEVTELLSSNDWEVGIPNLIEAGYCPDEGTCRVLWNSGTYGEGNNSLCWGHYSWEVTFQRTW